MVPPSAFTIRPAAAGDAAGLARLLTVLGHATDPADVAARWPRWAAAGNSALVAVAAGAPDLLGMATLHRMDVLHRPHPVGRITALVVDPSARGRGIGRALVAASEAEHRRLGCGLLEITSHVRLADAHAFYEHLGYQRTSLRFAKVLDAAP